MLFLSVTRGRRIFDHLLKSEIKEFIRQTDFEQQNFSISFT